MAENTFLDILYNKTNELKDLLDNLDNLDYSKHQIQYLISGYIIQLDSILELGIGEMHSSKLDELTSLIYYTRQKIVHYGYFNSLNNIIEEANQIVDMTLENYEKEKEFQKKLFSTNKLVSYNNVVINNSERIEADSCFYTFKSKDNSQVLSVPLMRVFSLTDMNRNKVFKYVINTDEIASLSTFKDGKVVDYKELRGDELKQFFANNYTICDENINSHNDAMADILNKFLSDPLSSSQIREYSSNEQHCKSTVSVIRDFIFDNSMYEGFLSHHNLISRRISIPAFNYSNPNQISQKMQKNLQKSLSMTDVFYIDITKKRLFDYFANSGILNATTPPQMYIPVLIQLFETGPKNFSDSFIKCTKEFEKSYEALHRYRQIFSHYLLDDKKYNEEAENFKKDFIQFALVLKNLSLKDIPAKGQSKTVPVLLIERSKKDFFNYKHEQFLKYQRNLYIGKKIRYSSRSTKGDSIIAIIPDSHTGDAMLHRRNEHGFIEPIFTIDENTKKKKHVSISDINIRGVKKSEVDFNLSELYKAYNALRNAKKNDIEIHFAPCEQNNQKEHYDSLENVILRCQIQGYIPIELLTKFKVDTSKVSKGIVYLLNQKSEVIAQVINPAICKVRKSYGKDAIDFFSRIDMIEHDFNKRRRDK